VPEPFELFDEALGLAFGIALGEVAAAEVGVDLTGTLERGARYVLTTRFSCQCERLACRTGDLRTGRGGGVIQIGGHVALETLASRPTREPWLRSWMHPLLQGCESGASAPSVEGFDVLALGPEVRAA
jgi:hypothetical protein